MERGGGTSTEERRERDEAQSASKGFGIFEPLMITNDHLFRMRFERRSRCPLPLAQMKRRVPGCERASTVPTAFGSYARSLGIIRHDDMNARMDATRLIAR